MSAPRAALLKRCAAMTFLWAAGIICGYWWGSAGIPDAEPSTVIGRRNDQSSRSQGNSGTHGRILTAADSLAEGNDARPMRKGDISTELLRALEEGEPFSEANVLLRISEMDGSEAESVPDTLVPYF